MLLSTFSLQVLGFIRDLFNSDLVRYTCVEDMTADISKLAENKLNITMEYMQKSQINNQWKGCWNTNSHESFVAYVSHKVYQALFNVEFYTFAIKYYTQLGFDLILA